MEPERGGVGCGVGRSQRKGENRRCMGYEMVTSVVNSFLKKISKGRIYKIIINSV